MHASTWHIVEKECVAVVFGVETKLGVGPLELKFFLIVMLYEPG